MQTLEGSTPDKQAIKPCDLTWVEFRLIDLDNNPVAGAAYEVKLTDGSTVTGRLDAQGSVRFSGISPGTASVSFVDLDAKEWTRV